MINFYTQYKEKWEKALSEACVLQGELKAPAYDNAVLLPLRRKKDATVVTVNGIYEGGVCTEDYTFVTGLHRSYSRKEENWCCVDSYVPEKNKLQR